MAALALLAFAAAPHFHDTADEHDDACAFCHAYGSPPVVSSIQADLDPAVGGRLHAEAPGRARNAQVKGYGSRAPPA